MGYIVWFVLDRKYCTTARQEDVEGCANCRGTDSNAPFRVVGGLCCGIGGEILDRCVFVRFLCLVLLLSLFCVFGAVDSAIGGDFMIRIVGYLHFME
jgi:hypothetical protein